MNKCDGCIQEALTHVRLACLRLACARQGFKNTRHQLRVADSYFDWFMKYYELKPKIIKRKR